MKRCICIYFHRSQIRQTLKKKAFEDAGIPVKQVSLMHQVTTPPQKPQLQSPTLVPMQTTQVTQQHIMPVQQHILHIQQPAHRQQHINQQKTLVGTVKIEKNADELGIIGSNSDMLMTLNRLNTHESEVYGEDLPTNNVKLGFDNDKVTEWNEFPFDGSPFDDEQFVWVCGREFNSIEKSAYICLDINIINMRTYLHWHIGKMKRTIRIYRFRYCSFTAIHHSKQTNKIET